MDQFKMDHCTGLYHKDSILDYLKGLLSEAESLGADDSGGKRVFTIALLDFDNFKATNEKYGHFFCDRILKKAGEIILEEIPDNARVGRYGGDEFIMVFADATFEKTFIKLENIRRQIKEYMHEFQVDNRKLEEGLTCSIGMASYPGDGKDVQEVLRFADEALYRSKKEGRDRICVAIEEKKVPKTIYFTRRQVDRISELASRLDKIESALYREGVDHIIKYYEKMMEKRDVEGFIQILVGDKILSQVEPLNKDLKQGLLSAVDEARGRLFRETGLDLPGVNISSGSHLAPNEMAFVVKGKEFSKVQVDFEKPELYSRIVRLVLDNLGKVMQEL